MMSQVPYLERGALAPSNNTVLKNPVKIKVLIRQAVGSKIN